MQFKSILLSFTIATFLLNNCSSQNRTQMEEHAHTNALINETSPYLLQHAHNPVNWYPWGEEALEKASQGREIDHCQHRLFLLSLVPRDGT